MQYIIFTGANAARFIAVAIQDNWSTFKTRCISGVPYLDYKITGLEEWGYIQLPAGRYSVVGMTRGIFQQPAAIHRLMGLETAKASYKEFHKLGLDKNYIILKIEQ